METRGEYHPHRAKGLLFQLTNSPEGDKKQKHTVAWKQYVSQVKLTIAWK
jgi:hypothetical protein